MISEVRDTNLDIFLQSSWILRVRKKKIFQVYRHQKLQWKETQTSIQFFFLKLLHWKIKNNETTI